MPSPISIYNISIHAPARGATQQTTVLRFASRFISIHAPARGATCPRGCKFCIVGEFQSTLPRGERHRAPRICLFRYTISIHAPARGATRKNQRGHLLHAISIHAPARGATSGSTCTRASSTISIHAPARGATDKAKASLNKQAFQSTLPRGERPYVMIYDKQKLNFNPRSREGSDLDPQVAASLFLQISIHAPARGATVAIQTGIFS